jgi:hypothetical protein
LRATSVPLGVQSEIEQLADALRREGAKSVIPHLNSIEFECPGVAGMRRYALLAPISGGSIFIVEQDAQLELTYSLQFVLAFWAALTFGVLFGLLNIGHDPLKYGALVFIWLFLGNVAISLYRFPRFLRLVLRGGSPPNKSLERTRER